MHRWAFRALVAATILWCGYWFVGARGMEAGLEAWLQDRRGEGWQAEWADVSVSGFPNRFDLHLSEVQLADTQSGWVWSAPWFKTFALSYRPTHVIANWPGEQTVQTPYQRLSIFGDSMEASAVLRPNAALTLDRTTFVFEGLEVRSDAGWRTRVAEARLATRPVEGADLTYDLGFEARMWVPPSQLFQRSAQLEALPDAFDRFSAAMQVRFDAPWDRFAIERARPQPQEIQIRRMEATWGQLQLAVVGELTVDAGGWPEGDLLVKAKNWRDILQLGVSSGLVPGSVAPTLEGGLSLISQLAGHPDTLDIPLRFEDRQVFAGPIPVGEAPNLRLR